MHPRPWNPARACGPQPRIYSCGPQSWTPPRGCLLAACSFSRGAPAALHNCWVRILICRLPGCGLQLLVSPCFFTHCSPPHVHRLPKARKTLESREICLHMRAVWLAGGSQTRELATSGLSIPGGHPGGWVQTLSAPPEAAHVRIDIDTYAT